MKRYVSYLSLTLLLVASSVNAQTLLNRSFSKAEPAVEAAVAEKEVTQTEGVTSLPSSDDKQSSVINEDEQGIPVKLSPEELAEADSNLRDNLRDTTKNDDLKARIDFLESNNYADKIMFRRKMLKHKYDFNISSRAANSLKKANVNPNDNNDMNKYLFERANVAESSDNKSQQ